MATRRKTPAQPNALVPTSREQAAQRVRELGDLQRQQLRIKAQLDDAIAHHQAIASPQLASLAKQIDAHHQAIQTWAEGHRSELTKDGRVKTVPLVTGDIGWRQRPPSVSVRNTEAVINDIKARGLSDYLRTAPEINKQAILAAASAHAALKPEDQSPRAEDLRLAMLDLKSIAGLRVVIGLEDFFVTPYETQAQLP